jgi:hypothetical protein
MPQLCTSLFQPSLHLLAQQGGGGGSGGDLAGLLVMVVWLALVVLMIAGLWKIFTKAGQPGWAAIVPVYNLYILTKIVGRPWWWLLLMLIPFISIIFAIILYVDLGKSFKKGIGFVIGLILLPFVFVPILGFGSAQYHGPSAAK